MILSFGTTAPQGPNQSGPHLNSERENSSAVCQLKTGWRETKVSEFRSQIHVPVFVIVVIKITFFTFGVSKLVQTPPIPSSIHCVSRCAACFAAVTFTVAERV